MKRKIAASLAVFVGFVCLLMLHGHNQLTMAFLALDDKNGYGERVTELSFSGPCGLGGTVFFLAQGGRQGKERQGYICTSYIGKASIREVADIKKYTNLDWH